LESLQGSPKSHSPAGIIERDKEGGDGMKKEGWSRKRRKEKKGGKGEENASGNFSPPLH